MPCKECKDGNYKYGNTGECKYATKDECEKANPKKYSKMQPTPLGKKTYEEYEKELKEFNLSSQKYEFNIGKLESELKKLDKLNSQIDSAGFKLLDLADDARATFSDVVTELSIVKKAAKELPVNKAYDNVVSRMKTLFKTFNIK
jgi:hypothetical protein